MRLFFVTALAAAIALGSRHAGQLSAQAALSPLTVTSPAFANGGPIPREHVGWGRGKDKSPPLSWTWAPAQAAQFAVIAEDPDAFNPFETGSPFVMWIVYGIPGTATGLPRALPPGRVESGTLTGTIQGLGTLDRRGERGGGVAPSITTADYARPGDPGTRPLQNGGGQPSALYLARPIMKPVVPVLKPRYRGPAPPPWDIPHRIIFTVYALDADLALPEGLEKQALLSAIEGHIVSKGELTGIFRR